MITVPTLLLDEAICRRNIKTMAEKARQNSLSLRPHFKTHQSREIGKWFREEGTRSITVSSLSMAEYFASDGWDDILVAFPVNILEIDTINKLAGSVRLSLLVESPDIVDYLSANLTSSVSLYVKADTGYGRTGISWNDSSAFGNIFEKIKDSKKLSLKGILTHAGNSYSARGKAEINSVHNDSRSKLLRLHDMFSGKYPDMIVSAGDTPSCSVADDFTGIDEIRPGNYVFYDYMQYVIGSCRSADIAVAMACPVVAAHPDRNEVVIYGGAIHFSRDSVTEKGNITSYGAVAESDDCRWGPVIEGAYLKKMSQEHGIVHVPDSLSRKYKPGDLVHILPVHSCLTAEQMKSYMTGNGKKIDHFRFS
ncbi:MAG: alanine racemase [Bacteroidales bacterium]